LIGDTSAVVASITKFLSNGFSTNTCPRHCYYNYRTAANDLFLSCQSEINTLNKTYVLASQLSKFTEFRNQGCNSNSSNSNCYESLLSLLATPPPIPGLNIFQFDCAYTTSSAVNGLILNGICQTFSKIGKCCASSAITMAMQNQLSPTKLTLFPPCLLQYLNNPLTCPSLAPLTSFCTNQSVAAQASIIGTLSVSVTALSYPDMYRNESVLTTMGLLSGALGAVGFNEQPYNFQSTYPFQVMFLGNETVLGPNGLVGQFPFQLTMQNVNTQQLQTLQIKMASQTFAAVLTKAFGGASFVSFGTESMQVLAANPLVLNNVQFVSFVILMWK
jgi:hypothetical protein